MHCEQLEYRRVIMNSKEILMLFLVLVALIHLTLTDPIPYGGRDGKNGQMGGSTVVFGFHRSSRRRLNNYDEETSHMSDDHNAQRTSEFYRSAKLSNLTTKLEHRMLLHILSAEKRINRKMEEKLRVLNQSLTIRHLQRLYHHVSEEVQLSREAGEDRAAVIDDLRKQVEDQHLEIDSLKHLVTGLQSTISNLTVILQQVIDDRVGTSTSTSRRPATTISHMTGTVRPTVPFSPLFPVDCEEVYVHGALPGDGDHYIMIQPFNSRQPFKVVCRAFNDSGWTLIQKRIDGSVDFYREWDLYKHGFGSLESEFWIGNEAIYELTNQGNYRLRIEMQDWDGNEYWAEYDHFRIENEADQYRLHIHGYHGNAGDSLTSAWNNHDTMPFSTKDRDNDKRFYDNCAEKFHGAWWFKNCFESHLNGVYYLKGSHNNFFVRNGIQWNTIHHHSSLRAVAMMIRPNSRGEVGEIHGDRIPNDIQ